MAGTPEAGLALGNDGTLYGTTAHGGTNDYGTVFKLSTNGVFTSLFSFTGSNTSFEARSPVLQAKDGYLYGTTIFGGSNGVGTGYGAIYKLKADGSSYKELYVFGTVTNSFSYPSDGAFAYAGLIQATDGNFYSTTGYGGIATNGSVGVHGGYGTIYRITPDGDFTTLYSFDYGEACVCSYGLPYARLVQAKDGNFYGTTWSASGTIFRLSVPMPAVFQTPPVTNNTFT
ncbi:MAG: choice-of-anchor tandem repeat GloVer-containing protein [Limisphaerales bacterium]